MKKYNILVVVLFLQSISFAQIGGTKSVHSSARLKEPTTVAADSSNTLKATLPLPQKTDSTQPSSPYPFPYFKAGDAIRISIYPDSALFLNGFYNIDQNGFIDLPILGLVSVKDKTRNEFIDQLKKEYSDYLKYPNINVTPYMRVSFFGGFYKPGLYWVESRNSLWDAIQIAGGVNREDGLNKVRWERNGTVVSNHIITDFQSGVSLQAMGFRSGDQICVTMKPKALFWQSFRDDVIPVLSISLTALTTALTAYQTYKVYNNK